MSELSANLCSALMTYASEIANSGDVSYKQSLIRDLKSGPIQLAIRSLSKSENLVDFLPNLAQPVTCGQLVWNLLEHPVCLSNVIPEIPNAKVHLRVGHSLAFGVCLEVVLSQTPSNWVKFQRLVGLIKPLP